MIPLISARNPNLQGVAESSGDGQLMYKGTSWFREPLLSCKYLTILEPSRLDRVAAAINPSWFI
jgi:hypothetical protein